MLHHDSKPQELYDKRQKEEATSDSATKRENANEQADGAGPMPNPSPRMNAWPHCLRLLIRSPSNTGLPRLPVKILLQIFHLVCSHNTETTSTCTACQQSWHGWWCAECNSMVPYLWTPTHHFGESGNIWNHVWNHIDSNHYAIFDMLDSQRSGNRKARRRRHISDALRDAIRSQRPCCTIPAETLQTCACCRSGPLQVPSRIFYGLQIKCLTCEEHRHYSAVAPDWLHIQALAVAMQCPKEVKEKQVDYLFKLTTGMPQHISQTSVDVLYFAKPDAHRHPMFRDALAMTEAS